MHDMCVSCMSLFLANFPGQMAGVTKSYGQTDLSGNTPSCILDYIIRISG